VDDSEQRNIRVYDFARDGTLSNAESSVRSRRETRRSTDGMKVDHDGNLFVTGPRGIWVWDAQGQHLGTIEMPEQPATSPGETTTTDPLHYSHHLGLSTAYEGAGLRAVSRTLMRGLEYRRNEYRKKLAGSSFDF